MSQTAAPNSFKARWLMFRSPAPAGEERRLSASGEAGQQRAQLRGCRAALAPRFQQGNLFPVVLGLFPVVAFRESEGHAVRTFV